MKWVLLVVSVIFGYIFSQAFNMVFVIFWFIGKRADSFALLPLITIIYFVIAGIATGFLMGLISRQLKNIASYIVAGLVVLVTLLNIYLNVAAESLSHKLIVIFVLAPAIIWGAYLVKSKTEKTENAE
jgi:hypothetical protein